MMSVDPLPAAGRCRAVPETHSKLSSGQVVRLIMDRMAQQLRDGASLSVADICKLCIWFAKAVDNAVANNDVPYKVSDLPQLVKKVYDRKNDRYVRPAVMVLMFAVKNACRRGWFQKSDTDEMLTLFNEISSHFCKGENFAVHKNNVFSFMSKVMARFCPQLRVESMDHVIMSVEAKVDAASLYELFEGGKAKGSSVGFGAVALDFHIPKKLRSSPEERIRLFVSHADNLETSACIISPPQVNFLINGIGVERRTTVFTESGAQLPTDITLMVKVGINLLQAVGNFSGNYIIAVAVMTMLPTPNATTLKDFVQPAVSEIPSENELIEGPSRISLHCPISFQRIKNPVKGQSCKHLQCFDYESFMEINFRKPNWRCPHCNHSVSYIDLRIDQNMLEVLREVGTYVSYVVISPDLSWKPCFENDMRVDQLHCSRGTGEHLDHSESQRCSVKCNNLLDLTEEAESIDKSPVRIGAGAKNSTQNTAQDTYPNSYDTTDRKPSEEILEGLTHPESLSGTPYLQNSSTSQRNGYQLLQNASARAASPYHVYDGCIFPVVPVPSVSLSDSSYSSNISTPLAVDTVATTPSRESVYTQAMYQPTQQSDQAGIHITVAEDNIRVQGSWAVTPNAIVESRRPPIPRNVTRVPLAVQALPAPFQMQDTLLRTRRDIIDSNAGVTNLPVASQPVPFTAANPNGLGAINFDMDWQQLLEQTNLAFPEHPSTMPLHSNPQDWQQHPNQPGLSALSQSSLWNSMEQQRAGVQMRQARSFQDSQIMNSRPGPTARIPRTNMQPENVVRPSSLFNSFPVQHSLQPSSNLTTNVHSPLTPRLAATQQSPLLQSSAPTPSPLSSGLSIPSSTGNSWHSSDQRMRVPLAPILADTSVEMVPEQNWRPSRMRGSIDISTLNFPVVHTPSMVRQILSQQHAQQAQASPSTVPSARATDLALAAANGILSGRSQTQPWAGNAAQR